MSYIFIYLFNQYQLYSYIDYKPIHNSMYNSNGIHIFWIHNLMIYDL